MPSSAGLAILREPTAPLLDGSNYQPMMREPGNLPRATGSRRRRIWEIAAHCHCAVIGLCLPVAALRKLVERSGFSPVSPDDYELHVATVTEARRRGPLTEALQKDLEQRHAATIRRFNDAKSAAMVRTLWDEHVERGEAAAALWAALTHARCDPDTEEAIYRSAHMLQHQAGAASRGDAARLCALTNEKTELARELERARDRYQQLQAAKAGECEAMTAELRRLRAEQVARDALISGLRDELEQVRRDAQDLESRQALNERIASLTERNRELLARLGQAPTYAGNRNAEADPVAAGDRHAQSITLQSAGTIDNESATQPLPAMVDIAPDTRAILCVGGLHRAVAVYREIVEKRGGRFIHHDGGREDSVHRLEANLAAADLVVCQAGCISHSAYWQVKDHCKRTGKRCIYLDKPSASALSRGLAENGQAMARAAQ